MKETIKEATERLQKDKYGVFISKDADVKGQLVIDTANAAFSSGMREGANWQKQQQDDFAIGFADWLYKWDNTRLPNGNWIIKLGLKPYTSEEVLEIYKKEKGL